MNACWFFPCVCYLFLYQSTLWDLPVWTRPQRSYNESYIKTPRLILQTSNIICNSKVNQWRVKTERAPDNSFGLEYSYYCSCMQSPHSMHIVCKLLIVYVISKKLNLMAHYLISPFLAHYLIGQTMFFIYFLQNCIRKMQNNNCHVTNYRHAQLTGNVLVRFSQGNEQMFLL